MWVDGIRPLRASGLASVSAVVVFNVMLYQSTQMQPLDALDPEMVHAVDDLCTAYCGDFTLGGLARQVDIFGAHGQALDVRAGYLVQDGTRQRVMTITLPVVVNDLWTEAHEAKRARRQPVHRGYDLSGDIQAVGNIGGGPAPLDFTGINKSAHERKGGRRDGRLQVTTFFNPGPAADAAHKVLSVLPRTDVTAMYCRGTALGAPSANLVGKQIGYDGTRGDDGSFTFGVEMQSNSYTVEWGRLLTAGKRTDTTATNGTSVDFGTGSTAFGLQAYLHVFAFTGTSVTVKVQQSSDNGGADAWADVIGGTFAAATAVGAQRIQTARNQTVERYLRVVTSGTFTNAVFAVSVIRNDVAVTY